MNFLNSHQSCGSLEDAKLARDHEYFSVLEDYSVLQKECISKKRKLRVALQKREILVDEVRFLRQRHAYLTKLHMETEFGPSQSADIQDGLVEKERNCIAHMTSIQEESNGREELAGKTPTTTDKLPKFSIKKKKSGNKKVSWDDNVVVIEI